MHNKIILLTIVVLVFLAASLGVALTQFQPTQFIVQSTHPLISDLEVNQNQGRLFLFNIARSPFKPLTLEVINDQGQYKTTINPKRIIITITDQQQLQQTFFSKEQGIYHSYSLTQNENNLNLFVHLNNQIIQEQPPEELITFINQIVISDLYSAIHPRLEKPTEDYSQAISSQINSVKLISQ